MNIFQFGEIISNLHINGKSAPYAVINERVARASAGILFVGAGFSFMQALYLDNRTYLSVFVLMFLFEFFIRVAINPKLAPAYALGKLLVMNQSPEWVGAIQKRFAWSLGLSMATVMTILILFLNYQGTINFVLCSVCLALLWLESACGICIGCKIYHSLIRIGIIKTPEVAPACPGNVCSIKPKHK